MKQVIIFEDDIHLAKMMQESINKLNEINCLHVFTSTREFFEKSWNDTPKKKKLDLLKQAYEREPRNNFN